MPRAQQVRDITHPLVCELGEHGGIDVQELAAERLADLDPVRGQQAVVGAVLTEWEQIGVGELGHGWHILVRDQGFPFIVIPALAWLVLVPPEYRGNDDAEL